MSLNTQQKLKLLLKFSGLNQADLAQRLGVTFAAFNRWVNGKAIPRLKAQEKIDELYSEYSGEKQVPQNILKAKKSFLANKRKSHRNVPGKILKSPDIKDVFFLFLTYHSNRIEGSTLSENETAAILFDNVALPNRSLVEQLEVKNHQTALEYLFQHVVKKKPVNEKLILKLHGILLNSIMANAGSYRNNSVRIAGANVPTANYLKVPQLMKELAHDLRDDSGDIIAGIAGIHSRFEKIHPFSDGNGRVGRLLMHAMAMRKNFTPVVILQEKRRLYMTYLNKAQTKDDTSLLEDFVCDSILEGYNILERK